MLRTSHQMIGFCAVPLTLTLMPSVLENIPLFGYVVSAHNQFGLTVASQEESVRNIGLGLYAFATFCFSTFPDIDHRFKEFFPLRQQHLRYLYHRQWTHSASLWVVLLCLGLWLLPKIGTPFYIWTLYMGMITGVWSHLVADMLTGTIPIGLYGAYNKPATRIGISTFVGVGGSTDKWFRNNLPDISDRFSMLYIPIIFALVILSVWSYKGVL